MYLRKLLLSLGILCLIAGGRSEPQFMFQIPGLLLSGETVRGCLDVQCHDEPMDVDIVLELGVNHTIIKEVVPVGNQNICSDLQVPVVFKSELVFIIITAVSGNFSYKTRRAVVVAPTTDATLIQTAKYMHKPGDTVRFNVFSLTNNLHPVDKTYDIIFVQDPAGNRLFQWQNQTTENGFLSLKFDLLADQGVGAYRITVEVQSSESATKEFMVEEYILPKFKVEVDATKSITILDRNLSFKATAIYTYGQGVQGKVTVRVCRPPANYYGGNACNRNPDGLCLQVTGELDSNGEFSGGLDLTLFQLDRSGYVMYLVAQLTVTEESTGVQMTALQTISIVSQLGRVYFDRTFMQQYYKKGLPYSVVLVAEDGVGQPLSNQSVELRVDGKTIQNLTTDAAGKAQYDLDTSDFSYPEINLQAIYKDPEQCYDSNWIVPYYSNDNYQVTRFYSRTGSFIKLLGPREELQSGLKYELTVQYLFGKAALKECGNAPNFKHMVMARTKIVEFDVHPIDIAKSVKGEFTFSFEATCDHAPEVDIIVYYMSEKEVMADRIHLSVEKCFKHKVVMEFSKETGTPGSSVDLTITAASGSLCAARVIDSSLMLLSQGQQLTADTVYSNIRYYLGGYYIEGYTIEPPSPPCINVNDYIQIDGVYYGPVGFPQEGDVFEIFRSLGMVVCAFNMTLHKPQVCGNTYVYGRPGSPMFAMDSVMATSAFAAAPESISKNIAVISSVRTLFPEVWYFNAIPVGESGSTSVPLEVPGTITGWKGDMICLSKESGIGMTKHPANFTSFQQFFVGFSPPYSCVRGEIVILKAFISNHMDKCAKVRATLQPSADYTAEPMDEENEQCICSGKRASYSWKLRPTSLGVLKINVTGETTHIGDSCEGPADRNQPALMDTMVQTFIVEAEGIRQEETKSDLVTVKGTTIEIPINLSPPANAVAGSVKAKINIIGDLLGSALTNPESLIREPTGCAEQTLSSLIPLPLVTQYLNLTGRLTEELKNRAVINMGIGYRRMLQFRNGDGSFSPFGRSEGSAWLTLLALKAFCLIKPYIPVEDRVGTQALVFLEQLQDLNTGAFKPKGALVSAALTGGADDDVGFTAAVVLVLLNCVYTSSPTLLRPALEYLDRASRKEQSVYNMALILSVFREAGNVERSNAVFQKLNDSSIAKDGTIYWERSIKPKQQTSRLFAHADSAEVAIVSYVLKALTRGKPPSQEMLNYMSQLALRLARWQNSRGSYSNTQDTAIALEALCSYGALVYEKDATNTVQVKYGNEVIGDFSLDVNNRILLLTVPLPHIPGEYLVVVGGTGSVLIQVAVEYNLPVSQDDSGFSLSVNYSPESCVNGVAYNFPVVFNISYHGIHNVSNMALIDLNLPSGYTVDYQSLQKLKNQVPKVEQNNNHVIVYLYSASSDITTISLMLEMGSMVFDFQQKALQVWDYYEKGENGAAVLRHPCSKM
ncbi:ovostatin-like [Mixophyes fleayi]|uniref:ovostatin-like n=1 Tax=Mixophyes fleayi TaxID=3061075 RepID=UPI003F4D973F